jgi:hypothetical protein
MAYPKASISACTTNTVSFDEDLAAYPATGVESIGLWEYKLPDGLDNRLRRKLAKPKLKVTLRVPRALSMIPDFQGPRFRFRGARLSVRDPPIGALQTRGNPSALP